MAERAPKDDAKSPAEPTPQTKDEPMEIVEDPSEDDLDDLDDMLDEFSIKADNEPTPASSGPGRPETSNKAGKRRTVEMDEASQEDDDVSRVSGEPNDGMADLLAEFATNPEMRQQFEAMLRAVGGQETVNAVRAAERGEDYVPPKPPTIDIPAGTVLPPPSTAPSSQVEASFQDTVRRTVERIQESNAAAGAAAADASVTEDQFFTALLRELEGSSGEGTGDDDFSKMLMGMMEQLTNKYILYDPMKELHSKLPEWIEKNRGKVPDEDIKRYEEQNRLVEEIIAKFEEPDYDDDNVEMRQIIVEKMQKMQSTGAPPPELVGDMDSAQEAMGELDSGCAQQ